MARWSNWAGNQTASGIRIDEPRDVEELCALVKRSGNVKVAGSGHSFTGIARPEDVMVVLSNFQGLQRVDRENCTVTVGAGTTLARLNEMLAGAGLAMTNLGDIESQTISGAISTGTHGTGRSFGGISTQVTGLEIVLADGSVVTCSPSERRDLWEAARVGLGALGIITSVTLQCVPLFAIRAEEAPMLLDELLERFDELADGHDHFEAYWFPHTKWTSTKKNTRLPLSDGLDRLSAWKEWLDDEFLSNTVFGWVVGIGKRQPRLIPRANQMSAKALGTRAFTDLSYRVFTSPRRVRFREMELAIPREAMVEATRQVVSAVESSGLRIGFPVEMRVAAADDIPLSTASERASGYLAFHVPASVDHETYFRLVARVLDPYQPRPHWGKLHDMDAEVLRGRYRRFEDFVTLRDRIDPQGLFSNAYLDRVLGPPK